MTDKIKKILDATWSLCEPFAKSTDFDSHVETKVVYDEGLFVKDPVVSVLVLTWRHENFIEECVNSICAQLTGFSFEVLIGEDASPDRTLDICLALQKRYPEQVKVIYSKENVGLVGNMVRLNKMARGEYVAICEGDDYWVDTRKLEKQVALLKEHNEVSLVHMGVWQQYEKCKWSRCPVAHKTIKRILDTNLLSATRQRILMLVQGNYIQTPTVMCRKIAFTKACEDLVAVERITHWIPSTDFMLWFFTMQHGSSYFIPDIVAVKRINGTSLTTIKDGKVANARILGDKRNALVMAEKDGFREDDVFKLISSLENAVARYNYEGRRNSVKMGPVHLLLKRVVLMLTRL